MRFNLLTLAAFTIALVAVISSCSSASQPGEHGSAEAASEREGEHGNEGAGEHAPQGGEEGEDGEEGGEESGAEYSLDATYDVIRGGVRLVMAYDAEDNAFSGTVENTTTQLLESVRVEVHLSNGIELGPTPPGDLGPGEKRSVRLEAGGTGFSGWTPHAEVGRNEHGQEANHS